MSSKPSTSKTTKLPPPNTILTRHKTNLMKRQLRNKDESVRKISQITQLLRSPTKDKTKVKKVKSPKTKKDKPEEKCPAKDKKKKKVKKLCIKPKLESTKRKLTLSEAAPVPTKRLKKPASPSVQDLVLLTEEQDLDDDDLLEILTCDSPVWWEDPPDPEYIEDAILTKSDMEQDSDSDFIDALESSSESLSTKTEEIQPTNFKIPHIKQVDDKFMKKRRKLEDLLGNIKSKTSTVIKNEKTDLNKNETLEVNKSTEIIKDKEDEQLTIDDVKKEEISSEEDIKESIKQDLQNIKEDKCDVVPIKEESEELEEEGVCDKFTRKKTSSTSTDEDPFWALRNEDILNDLQNMNIPIGNDPCSPDVNVEDHSKDTENTDIILETDKDSLVKDLVKDNDKESVDEIINETTLPSNTKTLIDEIKLIFNTESEALDKTKIIEANFKDSSEISEKFASNLAPEQTFSITSIEKESSSPISFQSISDASSAVNVDTISDTNIRFTEECSSISSKTLEISKNDIKSEECKNDKVDCEKEELLLNKDPIISSNEELNTDKNKESNTNQNKESNTDSNKDSSEDSSKEPKTYSRKDTNSKLNKESGSDPSKDFSTSSSKDSNKEDQIPESKTKSNKEDQKRESTTKSKNFNREQLMAVYKIITNKQYKDSFNKNNESKSNKNEALKNKTLNQLDYVDSLLKKCSDPQKTKSKPELSNITISETTGDKKSEENSSNLKENRKSPCLKCKNRGVDTNPSLNIVSNGKSAKYCLKCSSIFETETCNYCAKKEKLSNNDCQCK